MILRCAKPHPWITIQSRAHNSGIYFLLFPTMVTRQATSLTICQACGKKVQGRVFRFTDVPDSAFCSFECQLDKTEITVREVTLKPMTGPQPPPVVFAGPVANELYDDRGCDCGVFYENQITVPKRHSLICFCPKCGGVTID